MNRNFFLKIIGFAKKNFPLIIALLFWLGLNIFFNAFIRDLFVTNDHNILGREKLLLSIFIIMSSLLLIFILVYLIVLLVKFLHKCFGSMLKFKLLSLFTLVVLLPIIPFINIGTQFIQTSMNLWFSKNFAQSFDMSNELIRSYYGEKKSALFEQADNVVAYFQSKKCSLFEVCRFLDDACQKAGVDNLTLLNDNVKFISQSGKSLWESDNNQNYFTKDMSFALSIYKQGVFFQEHGDDLFLVVPIEILDSKNKLCGYINAANQINPLFQTAMTNIQESLRNYNLVSLYRNFFLKSFNILFISSVIPIFLIILVFSIFFSGEIIRPITDLEQMTKNVANDNFVMLDTTRYSDEFASLTESFNAMIKEIQFSRKQLQQQEQIASWNEISRRFAHEIRNPLTSIQLSIERMIMKYERNSEEFSKVFTKTSNAVLHEVQRMNTMLTNFSQMASLSQNKLELGGILDILKDSVDLLSINKNHVVLQINADIIDFTVNRDEVQLKSVFNNLLINAIDASSEGGKIEIDMQEETVGFKKYALITIKDYGTGIVGATDGVKAVDIFQPYYSTKPSGTGLGLSICQRIIDQHNGRIFYKSSVDPVDHGTTFFIELPIETGNT